MQLLDIPGVGEKIAHTLNVHGINSPESLLRYYPRTHRLYRSRDIRHAVVGEWTIFTGCLTKPFSRHRGRLSLQSSTLSDATGSLPLRWFNSPFILRSIKTDTEYLVMGRVESFAGKLQLVNPTLKILNPESKIPITLYLPIYTPLGSLKSGTIRKLIRSALDTIKLRDPLSATMLAEHHLAPLNDTLSNIHFPNSEASLNSAIHRLGFDELVALQSESLLLKESMSPPTIPLKGNHQHLSTWLKNLPYTPTASQSTVIQQVIADLSSPRAMHRLVTGDVGSGKTLVAAAAALWTSDSCHRTLVLAPTQILAEQLYTTLQSYLGDELTTSLITRTQKGDTDAMIIIGTHALLSSKNQFRGVGLVIIDEQHRFGVKDRESLRTLNPTPHLLMLSATPIPRTLAMTTLSHLDLSPMTDMPAGRIGVKSYVITKGKRDAAYAWLKDKITTEHQQAFIVTPLIEQADNLEESPQIALKTLESNLKKQFPTLKIAYLHGKMKGVDKTRILKQFRERAADILVATSMIEVGLDIPKVNIIFIENAELFGLATLHQLRGRVGRGGGEGQCFLLTPKTDTKSLKRLGMFVRETNGAKLAQYDLALRGAGDIFGTLQSGSLGLRFASLSDSHLLAQARHVATTLAKNT